MTAAGYVVAPLAEADLEEAAAWIAADDPRAAERFLLATEKAFRMLAKRPALGHRRPDLTPRDVRFWPVQRRFLVVYRGAAPLQVVRVLSAYRDVAAILSGPEDR